MHTPFKDTLAPDFTAFKQNASLLYNLNKAGKVSAMYTISAGGVAEAISKMAFGNKIGLSLDETAFLTLKTDDENNTNAKWFLPFYGSIIVETSENLINLAKDEQAETKNIYSLGKTTTEPTISIGSTTISLEEAEKAWESTLAQVFPPLFDKKATIPMPAFAQNEHSSVQSTTAKYNIITKNNRAPRVLIPVFPGTNGEYDMARAFSLAGANTKILLFRNNTPQALEESFKELEKELSTAQILALSGGSCAGDEPDGAGKFITNVLRQNRIADALMNGIKQRDSLILGICNGFQALIKSGLIPYGEIRTPLADMPTVSFNPIGRHISRMVKTRLTSAISPWAHHKSVLNRIHDLPISHAEGRIICNEALAHELFANGQVFAQYIDQTENPAIKEPANPNMSAFAIESLTSPDGRILGKMAHSERTITRETQNNLIKNYDGNKTQDIFSAGVSYFQ